MGRIDPEERHRLGKLYETEGEARDRELREKDKTIADLRHQLDVAERTAKVAASLLLKKKI